MELIQEFKNYLLSQKNAASPATVKNYIADVKKFIVWFEQANNSSFNPQLITVKVLGDFKSIKSKELSASSLDRHISSLKKFFTFLKLEGHMSQSPFELIAQATPVKTDPYHLKEFKDFLYVYNASHLTIKNYLIDVKQFFMWLEKVALTEDSYLLSDKNLLHKINDDLIQEYSDRLLQEGTFSPSTINRKLSSLRKYLSWASSQGLLTDGITVLPGNVKLSEVQTQAQGWQEGRDSRQGGLSESEGALAGGNSLTGPQAVETHFENQIHDAIPNQTEDVEENTNSAYSSFAPIRLSQKISRGFSLLLDVALVVPVAQLIAALQHRIWILRGKPLFTISSPKLKVLQTPLALTGTKVKNISKSFYNPLGISITHFPWYKKFAFHLQYTRPKWYKRYHRLPVSRYFNWAILIVFCTMIGFGLYSSFFSNARKNQTLAALPTAPPRVLSFQGRLTDNNDNPITTANTHLRFAIYDDTSATGSGHLLWQEVDTVSPDTDGDFSTLLGDGSSCGSPLTPATGPCQIPSTLFSQNASLYLGVTVEWTPELAPRQRLATVAYAANSETLQGLPPITAAGAGTQNVVLALDSSGNLAIGASTTFQSTSGQFSLSGNTIAINTNPGSNGNITLSPDGSGLVDVQKPLQNSTLNNNIPSAAGAVEVDDLFAILATSSGQSALTINQNSTGPLISASTSGVAKFTVDNAGDVFAAGNITGGTLFAGNGTTYYINNNTSNLNSLTLTGNLNVSGNVTSSLIPDSTLRDLGSVTNYWGNVYATNIISPGSGVSGYWQRNSGAVSPANITDDVLVGGVSTASAKFQIFGTTGNATSTGTFTFTGANPTIQTTSMLPLVIGSSSTGSIQLSPNGTTGLYVSASGNVGIGTTNPIQALSVNGTVLVTTSGGGIELTSNSGFTRYSLKYGTDGILGGSNDLTLTNREINGALRLATSGSLGGSSGETTRLYITSAGFVGIGSTSFGNAQLVVNQTNTSGAGDIFSASTSGVTKFTIQNNGTASTSGNLVFAGTNPTINTTNMNPLTIGSASTGPIQLSPKGTTGLYVDGTGNVGIGTTNPSSFILQTAGSIGPTATNTYDLGSLALQWNNVYANNIFQNGTAITQLWQLNQGALAPLNTSNDLLLGGNSTTSAVFGFTNVAAGTPTATISGNFSLQVPSGNSAAEKINLLNNTTLGIYTSPGGDSGLSANPAIFVNNSGNVGIGTNNPSTAQLLIGQKADVNIAGGTGYAININSGSNTILKIGENSTSGALVQSSSSLPLLLNANGNNVGIATTNPSVFKLQIAGHTGPDANNTYDLGASTQQWRNIYGQHVFANGVEVTQMWQENLGALSPLNITDDLLLGATSTTSARFAVTNIAGGTPTASLSAGTNSGTYITADGTLATRSKQTLALGSQSSTGNINLGSDATARNITIGNTTGATGLTLQTGTGNFSLDGVAGSTYAIGASTIGGTITIGGASQTGTLTLGQSTAGENINIGSAANSAAQQIQIGNGASTANSEVDILSGAGTSGTSTLALANNPRVGTIDIGNVTSTVIRTFTIAGGNDANNDTVNILTGNPSNGTQTINLLTGNATGGTQTLNLATGTSAKAINIGGTGANTIALGNTQTGGSISLGAAMTTGTISLGGTGLQTGSITIGNGTGNQTIDLGNGSGNKTIDIGGSGTNTLNIGSSQTNGNINIGNATSTTTIKGTNFTTGGVAYATSNTLNFTSSGSSGQCLLSNALSAPTWGLCTFGNGNYWNLQQGALFPINATVDFLVGADNGASSSAKFAALNLASGTPTASVSSGLNGTGMSIDANGNIQTANKMTLTLGGNKTGNIVLKPNNGASGTITFSGYSTGVLHSVSGLITSSQVDLQNDITSTLKVDHGGTGLTSLASGSLIYGSGGGTANSLAIGNTNDMLVTLGGVPTWSPYATLSALFVTNNTQLNTISSANNTILPTTNGTLNLGDGAHFFGTIYANNIIAPVGSGTSGFWQLAADVLAPVNTIYDLAVGGSATGSATPWQVFGTTVGVDTAGTATSSGNLAFRGASTEIDLLNGTGLNIKASVGGDAGLTSVLNISNLGNVTIAGTLAVNGNTLSTGTSSTFSLLNGTLSTLNFAQGTSTLTIGTGGTTSTTINGNVTLGDNTALRTINFGGEVGTDIIPNSNNSHDLGSSSNFWRNIYTNNTFANAVTGTQGYWQLNSSVISPAYNWQDLGIGGTSTSSAQFQVFGSQFANGSALNGGVIPAGTASSSAGITFKGSGTNHQISLLNNGTLGFYNSVGGDAGLGINPALYIANSGNIGIGTTNPSSPLHIYADSATTADLLLGTGANASSYISFSGARGLLGFDSAGGAVYFSGGLSSNPKHVELQTGGTTRLYISNLNGYVGIGIGASLSLLGNTQLVVNQTNAAGLGDIFSASTSGTPEFTIANDGTIKNSLIPNQNDFYSLGSDPTAGGKEWDTLYVRQVVTPSGALGTNYWQVSNQGVLSPSNLTWDLGIGGNSTAAATFHVVGSGQNSGQMTITANGITTANVASIAATALTSGNLLNLTASDPQVNNNTGKLLASADLINVGSADHSYMTLTNSDLTIGGHKNLTTISNVSKVFIYDTSSDSDGGRWTNDERAQASSWYNEARTAADACVLGTNSRCGQQAFPRKAIIVATANTNSQGPGVYIFDAKDNSLWMSFTKGSGTTDNMIGPTTNSGGKSVFALNGKIYFATIGSSYGGLYVIDFKKDSAVRYDNSNGYQVGNQTIANRNNTMTWTTDYNINTVLTGNSVRDVYANVVNGKTYFAVATVNGPKGCFTLVNDSDESLVARFGVSSGCAGLQTWLTSTGTLYGTYGNAASPTNYALKIKYNAQNASGDNQLFDEVYANISSSNYGATKFDTNTFANLTLSPGPASTSATFVPSSMYVTEGTSTVDGVSDTVYLGAQGSNGALMALQTKKGDPSNGSIKYYNQNFITEDLVGDIRGYWPLNESSGNIVDASVKGITLTASSSGITYGVSGVRGTGVTLNGTSGYFSCSDTNPNCGGTTNLDPSGTSWSMGSWIKTSASATQMIISKFNSGVAGSYYLDVDSTGHVNFSINNNPNDVSVRTVNDGNWHYVVATYDSTKTMHIYIDGQLDSSQANVISLVNSSADFAIGASFSNGFATNWFHGSIDEPFVTAETLTNGQIERMYQVGYRALQNHAAQTIRGVNIAQDASQKLANNNSNVSAVAASMQNGKIYIGTNNGGVSVIGMDSDTLEDVYNSTITTTDDTGTSWTSPFNYVVSLAVGQSYGNGTLLSIGSFSSGVGGTAGLWAESQDTTLKDFFATNYNPFGSNLLQSNLTIDNMLRVTNQLSTRFDYFDSTSSAQLADLFRVDNMGQLYSRTASASAFAFQIQDPSGNNLLNIDSRNLGNPVLTINQPGGGDILTGSSSGATKFRFDNAGILYANEFIDIQNNSYFLDPANSINSMDVAGNVGIGTTTPHSLLSLGTSAPNGTPAISVYDDGTQFMGFGAGTNEFRIFGAASGTNHISFGKYGSSTWTEQMRLDNNGNVGIGTTNPADKLEVQQNVAGAVGIIVRNISGNSGAYSYVQVGSDLDNNAGILRQSSTNSGYAGANGIELYTLGAYPVGLATNNIERLTVLSGGNVGIGTTNPANKLQISGSGGLSVDLDVNGRIMTGDANNTGGVWLNSGTSQFIGQVSSSVAGIYNNGHWGLAVDNSGNVGIGTTGPGFGLDVWSGTTFTNTMRVTGNTGTAGSGAGIEFDPRTRNGGTGHTWAIYADNDTRFAFKDLTNNAVYFNIFANGQIAPAAYGSGGSTVCDNGTIISLCSSDQRLKTNINYSDPSYANVLSKINQLQPVSFNWISDGQYKVGFIAQDIQKVLPNVVQYQNPSTGMWVFDTADLIPYIVKGMQVMDATVSAQQSQLATIQNLELNQTGDITINAATPSADFSIPHYFTLNDALGNPISRMGAFVELVVGNLRVGSAQAQQVLTNSLAVATDNVSIAGQSLHDYIVNVVDQVLQTTSGAITSSPIASIDELHTNLVSPIATDSAIALDLQNSKVSVKNTTTGQTVASIDNTGNATFSGTVNSQNLAVNGDATISGTLHVNQIQANSIAGLQEVVGTLSAQTVNNVTNIYFASPSSTTTGENNTPGSGNSGNNYNGVLTDSGGYANIASFSAYLSYVPNLNATTGMFSDGLISLGPTALTDTTISGTLTIGNQLILADNTINVLGQDVQIQPLRQGGIAFAGGQVHIDSDGNLNVYGKAMFNSDLAARIISPLSGEDLTINLPSDSNHQSSFVIQNASSSAVFSVNQLGDLVASGEATIAKLNLNIAQPAFAISSTEVVATGSAGTAAIGAHQTELTIDNVHVTSNSLIYITPVGQSLQTPYLLRQVPGTSFTVGIQSAQLIQTPFNWLIVN